jgi:hypothetical protein
VRALALVLAGCATSTELGVIQRGVGDNLGGSLGGHMGIGAVGSNTFVVEGSIRGDIGQANSRFAIGTSVLGGLQLGRYRALARAGIWHAVASNASENGVVPTVEVGAFIPLRGDPVDDGSKYGWSASGLVVGVREDVDVAAYTTIFIGLQLWLVPGY